ncbi:MAG: cysteine synthase family protein [Dehalococcoidales bacterium]|nr:MAG: cysteine synthase family protein [Dehalococcoidales bacterium]
MYYKNISDAIGHTPLVELKNFSPKESVKILAKLEGQNPGGSGSIKDRIARYMIEKAEESGELTKDKTIIEATSGNTGIALAWLGRLKGYKVTIVMPDSMSLERRQLMELHGAELILTDGTYGVQRSIDTVDEMAAKDSKYFKADQFANPTNPLAHYETTGVEILDDNPYNRIDYLIAGIGTGGTLMGIARRLKETYPDVKIIGAEPPLGDPIQGLRCLEEYVPPILDLKLLDERAITTSEEAVNANRELLEKEGIFSGMSSGAVMYQAKKIASHIEEGCIIVVLADAGWKYLSMNLWANS